MTAILLLSLAACGGDARAAGPMVRDSAGIQIVQNDAPAWKKGQEWRVSAEPLLDVGVVDGEAAYQLDDVAGVVRLSDGRIVVADGGSHELRFFSPEGKHLVSAGREGGGPGEFQRISWIGAAPGDSVLAFDSQASRISVFASDGTFARAFAPAGLHAFAGVEAAIGGALLMTPGFDPETMDLRAEGEYRDTAVWLRVPLSGEAAREVSRRPGLEMFFSKGGGMYITEPVVFGRGLYVAGGPDGYYAAASDRWEVEHRGPDGALRRLIRRVHEPRKVTQADVDAYFQGQRTMDLSQMPPDMRARFAEKQRTQRERVPRRATLPAFAQLLLDGAGNLWVRDPRPDEEQPHRWSVFDSDGQWLGTVQTPPALMVRQIGTDWILGTEQDELEVEHVRLYRLEKSAAD
ncbi:MAG TPA: hypothetical protein VHG93_18960 [Longimicrobium sp.]|nr:hypothetical protein [Longimicrobium sp.]